MKFAECMRENGISEFPDPDASGELTIDGVVNGSSLDPSGPAWKGAIAACEDLQPPGFTGDEEGPPRSRRRASSSPSASAITAWRTFRIPPVVSPSSTRIESHPPTRRVV